MAVHDLPTDVVKLALPVDELAGLDSPTVQASLKDSSLIRLSLSSASGSVAPSHDRKQACVPRSAHVVGPAWCGSNTHHWV